MGSCFAQHLSNYISRSGFNYYVTEAGPGDLTAAQARMRNYGVFSARYGNVYTVRQALQLFDRAFNNFEPTESIWRKEDAFIDPYRPQIEPNGFASERELIADRRLHLSQVREIFERTDVLVFTLGLTESWRSKSDGAIFPLAPGVAGGGFDPARHEFINFSAALVQSDLYSFIDKIVAVNPSVKIILTVSPVPLIATYEPRHVLVSTAVSKAVLRVAADSAERRYDNVTYFPSYEVITSPAGTKYFDDDLRQVKQVGVNHVMRLFRKHFLAEEQKEAKGLASATAESATPIDDVICDEETIAFAIARSGF